MKIRTMSPEDWPAVSRIYREGIATGFATFEKEVPSYENWDKAHVKDCRLVGLDADTIAGWAALSPVSSRCVYGGVAEVSVYIGKEYWSLGIGKKLLGSLIDTSEQAGYWTLQSGIFPENKGSIKIHEQCGFRLIGCRERVGKLDGAWKDNLIFERRSPTVGID
ncbi:N-acetyltransferase family protein [Muriicola sp.]|uniref:GNAT family N-acetyltransferase n=1 Tax=Muriicola sp. TaxID=2020856 RepID=UPI003C71AF02